MNDIVLILIVAASLIASIREYRKLTIEFSSMNSREDFFRFVGENALMNYINNMNDEEFKYFCSEYFRTSGYMVKICDNNMLIIKNFNETIYVMYLKNNKNAAFDISKAWSLYGLMCHDKVKKGIIMTTSPFDENTSRFCSESNIRPIGLHDILNELKYDKHQEIPELLPHLNS